jgi:hypothetical protein
MRKAVLTATIMLLAGCANPNAKRNEQIAENALATMDRCIKSPGQRNKAGCVQDFYNQIQSISNDDPDKLPVLRAATAMYALFTKVDRNQISDSDMRYEGMRIQNDLALDIQASRQRSVAERRAAALQQQQMFLNAQRLLAPQGAVITCYRNQSTQTTTCY